MKEVFERVRERERESSFTSDNLLFGTLLFKITFSFGSPVKAIASAQSNERFKTVKIRNLKLVL